MIVPNSIWQYMLQQVNTYEATKNLLWDRKCQVVNDSAIYYMRKIYDNNWENMKKDALDNSSCRSILEVIEKILFAEDMERTVLDKEIE